jgi:hypothetical protein
VVAEAKTEALAECGVEGILAGVPEGCVAEVVAEPDRLGQILVQPKRAGDDPRDSGRLQRVGHPGAVVVALWIDEDLGLALQPAERFRVHDPVAVALERRAHRTRLLVALAPAGLVRANGKRREPGVLLLAHTRLERISDPPRQLGHHVPA